MFRKPRVAWAALDSVWPIRIPALSNMFQRGCFKEGTRPQLFYLLCNAPFHEGPHDKTHHVPVAVVVVVVMDYDHLLKEIGGFGRWQRRVFALVCLVAAANGLITLSQAFTLFSPQFRYRTTPQTLQWGPHLASLISTHNDLNVE